MLFVIFKFKWPLGPSIKNKHLIGSDMIFGAIYKCYNLPTYLTNDIFPIPTEANYFQ